MSKPSDEAVARFKAVAPGGPEAEERKIFGQPCAFVGGNMFMGLYGDLFQVRLPEAERDEALRAGAVPFEPMGRRMKEYVVLPSEVVNHEEQLRSWVARAYAHALTLPAKGPKAPESTAAPKTRSSAKHGPA